MCLAKNRLLVAFALALALLTLAGSGLVAAQPQPPSKVVVIDPGHGGSESGGAHYNVKTKKYDLLEKDVNLRVAQRLAARLQAAGYLAILSRNTDTQVNAAHLDVNGNKKIDVDDDLQARIDLANSNHAAIFVSLHHDSRSYDPTADFTTVYYCADRPFAAQSAQLAASLAAAFAAEWQQQGWAIPVQPISPDDVLKKPGGHLYLLGPKNWRVPRPSTMPGALAEPLFLTNEYASSLVRQPGFYDAEADAYFQGIVSYFNTVK